MNKGQWLSAAEVIDALRLIPRLLLVGYCFFVLWLADTLIQWYITLPAAERGMESGGFAGGLFTAATGLATLFLNAYLNSGRKWHG